MKILVASGSRVGGTAYCDIQPVDKNLNEYMNIEDTILPRTADDKIMYEYCTQQFLFSLELGDFAGAYDNASRPEGAYYKYVDEKLTQQKISREEFLSLHTTRWNDLQKIDSWCVKVMEYHNVPHNILTEIIATADKVVILKRRNKIAQVISMVKTEIADIWHNHQYTTNCTIEFDYAKFKDLCQSVGHTNTWLDNTFNSAKTVTEYYEDIDLSTSKYKKNANTIDVDMNKCKLIYEEVIGNLYSS